MPKEQRPFMKEVKLEAVQLVQKSGKSQAYVARDLRMAESTLHHWYQELAQAGTQAFPGSGHQTAQEEELTRLKRELEVTRTEEVISEFSSSEKVRESRSRFHRRKRKQRWLAVHEAGRSDAPRLVLSFWVRIDTRRVTLVLLLRERSQEPFPVAVAHHAWVGRRRGFCIPD